MVLKTERLQVDTKKRGREREGFMLDKKIFDAMFYVAVFEKHVLKLHITKEMEKRMD